MVYAVVFKHNYVLGGMLFTICKAQLHVPTTNVGHLQAVQWKLISYTWICWGVCKVQGQRCKCKISQVWGVGALDFGCLGTIYRHRTMPTYSYV